MKSNRIRPAALAALVLAGGAALAALAQAPPQPYAPKQSDRPTPLEGDEPGFQQIFDGKSLAGWDGDPTHWRVESGSLVGEITQATVIKSNTFVIWRGGRPRDFDLKLDYRITPDGNSGINYRSVVVSDPVTPANKFAMRGYQFDIDGRNRYTGNNYEERGGCSSPSAASSRAWSADARPCSSRASATRPRSPRPPPTAGTRRTSSRAAGR